MDLQRREGEYDSQSVEERNKVKPELLKLQGKNSEEILWNFHLF